MSNPHINETDGRFPGAWRKSSRSDGNNACVEFQVASDLGLVGICDSKEGQAGRVLTFPTEVWAAFVKEIKLGRF